MAHRTPVLLVPSLINRHYVLDLLPQKSFAAHMVAQGHEVYAIDWGLPTDEDRYLTFDDICDRYLGRATRLVAQASTRGKTHLLGYFLDKAWTDESLEGFIALETWGNDNIAFPGACYQRYVEELYRKDALLKGTFTLSGLPARLENITCPTLSVTFEHDTIVPWPSAAKLIDRVSAEDKQRLHQPGSHVGAVVSQKASKTLWPQISAWWAARDGEKASAKTG